MHILILICIKVKYLPKWFPGAKFQREAEMWRPFVYAMLNEPFDYVKSHLVRRISVIFLSIFKLMLTS